MVTPPAADVHEVVTVGEICQGIVAERAESVRWAGGMFIAEVADIAASQVWHTITARGGVDPLSGEVHIDDPGSITIDGLGVRTVGDLAWLGLDAVQIERIRVHVANTREIEDIITASRTRRPRLLATVAGSVAGTLPLPLEPGELPVGAGARYLATLPAREAFIVADACGNADGVSGNPLRNLMMGDARGALSHHPIARAFHHKHSAVVAVGYERGMEHEGTLPTEIADEIKCQLGVGSLDGIGFVHPYSLDVSRAGGRGLPGAVVGQIDAFVLMSKRSLAPVRGDFQIKVGFDGRITAHSRTIHPGEAHNALANSRTFAALAARGMLPDRTWVLPEFFSGSASGDPRTTFLIRGGLRHALHSGGAGLPDAMTPLTACSLWSRNILNPRVTLFEDLVALGFDRHALSSEIVTGIVHLYLDFLHIGIVPEAHSQNVLYAFDLERRVLCGFVLRDLADSYLMPDRLAEAGIVYDGVHAPDVDEMIISRLPPDAVHRRALATQKFHHKILHLHVEPLARLLHQTYGDPLDRLPNVADDAVDEWEDRHPDVDLSAGMERDVRYTINRVATALQFPGDQYRRRVGRPNIMGRRSAG